MFLQKPREKWEYRIIVGFPCTTYTYPTERNSLPLLSRIGKRANISAGKPCDRYRRKEMQRLMRRGVRRARRGFSLLTVLMLSVIGVVLAAGAMHIASTSAGSRTVMVAENVGYNIMQQGVEHGKAILKERMNNEDPPPRWMDKPGATSNIETLAMLLIEDGVVVDRLLTDRERHSLGAREGRLTISIFDAEYDASKVAITDEAVIRRLPPSLQLQGSQKWNQGGSLAPDDPGSGTIGGSSASNAGVYLIRATLTITDHRGNTLEKFVDSVVIQSNMS